MMINCPKCNLLQPKDQYCAGCGINMSSWQPPETPFIKKLISNWIFQLSILFIIVLVLVLRDSFSPPTKNKISSAPDYPTYEQKESFDSEQKSFEADTPKEKTLFARSKNKTKKIEKLGLKKSQKINTQSQLSPLKKNINARIYLAPRPQVENLINLGQKVDDGVGYISKSDFKKSISENKKGWKTADSIRKSFQFNRPKILFSGERSNESNKNIGFYFEVTVFDNTASENISFELKSWNELKPSSGQEDSISYELNLPRNQLAIISGIVSRDHVFTEEDRSLFDSSSTLQVLNNESFIEEYSDILLVLELN